MKTEQQLQLVNFEQAKRLKEAGFNWECDYAYVEAGLVFMQYDNNDGRLNRNAAPTVALALKWFRDNIGVNYSLLPQKNNTASFKLYDVTEWADFKTYEAAESALLDELLTLIENKQ